MRDRRTNSKLFLSEEILNVFVIILYDMFSASIRLYFDLSCKKKKHSKISDSLYDESSQKKGEFLKREKELEKQNEVGSAFIDRSLSDLSVVIVPW